MSSSAVAIYIVCNTKEALGVTSLQYTAACALGYLTQYNRTVALQLAIWLPPSRGQSVTGGTSALGRTGGCTLRSPPGAGSPWVLLSWVYSGGTLLPSIFCKIQKIKRVAGRKAPLVRAFSWPVCVSLCATETKRKKTGERNIGGAAG